MGKEKGVRVMRGREKEGCYKERRLGRKGGVRRKREKLF